MDQNPLPSRDEHVTVTQALASLPISRSTLYRLLAAEAVPGIRFGRSWRMTVGTVRDIAVHGVPSRSAVA